MAAFEQDEKLALEETQQAVLEKTTPTPAVAPQPNKRAKSAGKKKWLSLAPTFSLSFSLRHFSTSLLNHSFVAWIWWINIGPNKG